MNDIPDLAGQAADGSIVASLGGSSLAILAFIALVAWLTPGLTRPDLFFAVTVRAWYRGTPEAHRIVWRYRFWVAVHLAIALGLVFAGHRLHPASPNAWLVALLLAIAWQQIGWFAAFQGARRRVEPHAAPPTTLREADLTPRRTRLPGGWALQAAPFAFLAAAALYLRLHWDSLPERFPVHWGLDGQPNGWSTRTPLGVFGPLLLAAVVAGSLALLGTLQMRGMRQIRAGGAAGTAERGQRRAVLWTLFLVECMLTATSIWVSLLPLRTIGPDGRSAGSPNLAPVVVLTFAVLLAVTIILARFGQGGTRAAGAAAEIAAESGTPGAPQAGGAVGDRSPDSCWKGGVIYYNPDDPALWVEKRFGIGYTLNFGRAASWVILFVILVLPLLGALAALRAAAR